MSKFNDTVLAPPPMYAEFESKFERLELSWRDALIECSVRYGAKVIKAIFGIAFVLINLSLGMTFVSETRIIDAVYQALKMVPIFSMLAAVIISMSCCYTFERKHGVMSKIDKQNDAECNAFEHYLTKRNWLVEARPIFSHLIVMLVVVYLISFFLPTSERSCEVNDETCLTLVKPKGFQSGKHFD